MGRRSLLPIFPIKTIYDDSVDRRRRRPAAPTVGAQTGAGHRNGEGAAAAVVVAGRRRRGRRDHLSFSSKNDAIGKGEKVHAARSPRSLSTLVFFLFFFLAPEKMRASRLLPLAMLTSIVLSCSGLLRLSAAEVEDSSSSFVGNGGGADSSSAASPSSFFDARLAASAADLSSLLSSLFAGGGEAKTLGPEELDVRVFCEPDRFLPAKRMPATLALPRLVARIGGGSCRAGGGAAGSNETSTALFGGLVSCEPGVQTSWFFQEPLLLPERTTPAALFAGSCSLSLYPALMKTKEGEAATATAAAAAAAATAAAAKNVGSGIIDAAFSAAPPLASSNGKRVQVLSAVVVRCESLEALKRGECSVVEGPPPAQQQQQQQRKGKEESREQKKRSRRAKEAAASEDGGSVLPSAGALAAEIGREIYETLLRAA